MNLRKNGKRIRLLLMIAMIATIGLVFFTKHASAGEMVAIDVSSPKQDDYWGYNTTHDIVWTSSATGSAFQIALCKQDKADKYVYTSLTLPNPNPKTDANGNGSYSWTVPVPVPDKDNNVLPGDDYFIRISWGNNPDCSKDSAEFSIGTPPITVTVPTNAGTVIRGTQVTVSWNYDKNVKIGDFVYLDLYDNNKHIMKLLDYVSPGTNGTGNCKITIPADLPLDKDYYIKVSSNLCDLICADSSIFKLTDKGNGSWENAADGTGITGNGLTAETAYGISSAEQLAYIAKMINTGNAIYTGAYYNLTGNINLYAYEWIPIGIGNNGSQFIGHFEGNSHTITGLRIGSENNPLSYKYAGFFGTLGKGASITNLGIIGASVHSNKYVGGLAGYCGGCRIENCYVTGEMTGFQAYVLGGLIGNFISSVSNPSIINNCHTDIIIKGGNMAVIGGLTGYNYGTIIDSYSLGNVEGGGASNTGGLVGYNVGDIYGSYSKCTTKAEGDSTIGGFVGYHDTGRIYDCYSAGNVTGGFADGMNSDVGAFAGYSNSNISNCYATGSVAGGKVLQGSSCAVAVGGFVGEVNGKIENCYAAGSITGQEGAFAGGFAGMNGGAGLLVNTYWNIDSIQTVNGAIRNQTDMLGCGDNMLVTCGLPIDVMKGAKPESFITYTDASGSVNAQGVIGAFFIALNGGRGALTTGTEYSWWTPDLGNINNGYPVFTDKAYQVTVGAGVNGTGKASHVNATQGETVTLTASPDAKYHLKEWTTDLPAGYSVNENTFKMPPQGVNITPVFEKNPPVKLAAPSKPSLAAGIATWAAAANENNGYSLNLYRNGSLNKTINRAHGDELSYNFSGQMAEDGSYTVTVTALGTGDYADSDASVESDPQVVAVAVTGVSVNKTNMNIYIGDSFTLTATVTPENSTNKAVTWTSSKTAAATVDSTGKVTGVSAGTAVITVTTADGAKKAECTVTVVAKPVIVTEVSLNKTDINIYIGDSETLTATITPENATNKAVTWDSSKTAAATVDSTGKVIGVSAGTAVITVTSADGGKKAECTVTVAAKPVNVTGVTLNKTNTKIYIGDNETLAATVTPENATNKAVTWTSGNTAAATVDNTGKVTGVSAGTAVITVTTADGSKKAECTVTVAAKPVNVTGVTLNKTNTNIYTGYSETLIANVSPENATNKAVTWISNNIAVATVDNNGKITGVFAGTAVITVRTADGAKKAECTVNVAAYPSAPEPAPEPLIITVTGITLDKSSFEFAIGQSQTLSAQVIPANSTDKTITWSSSDSSVASVDNSGTVTAVNAGTATITAAAAGGKTATCSVTVVRYSKEAIRQMLDQIQVTASKSSIFIRENSEIITELPDTLKKAVADGDCSYDVTYRSSKKRTARVTTEGNVTGVNKGTITIETNITVNGITKSFETGIQVRKPYIEITQKTGRMKIGRSFTFKAVGHGVDTSLIKWSTTENSIVVIQENGLAKAMSKGTDYVIASTEGASKSIKVVVK